jgi:serine/threonine protein kinase
MRFFSDCAVFADIGYDLSARDFRHVAGFALDDDRAVELIYNTFDVVDRLHKARVILGDVNPNNLLYNRRSNHPVIIDVDSAQVGQFRCLTWSDEYLDPLIEQQGKNTLGGYTYSFESDIFSLACVLFELVVGVHPYCVTTDPPIGIVRNKEVGLSRLSVLERHPLPQGMRYVPKAMDSGIESRLNTIRTRWPKLYIFFASTFIHGHRTNLMESLDRSDPRHPAYVFYSKSGFDRAWTEWVESQRPARIPVSAVPGPRPFVMPDSGFSAALGAVALNNVVQSERIDGRTNQPVAPAGSARDITRTDPPELSVFLSHYQVHIANSLRAA